MGTSGSTRGRSTLESGLLDAISTSYERHPVDLGSDRFELVRELGRGGFGVVYEAVDHGLPGAPTVALKRLVRAQPERLYHFKREFRSLAEMRHPNLVQLYELVATDPAIFFTMELVVGESPLSFVRGRPTEARHVLRELSMGLSALHEAGTIHRDVKPSNILVEASGRVVLLDFGLAMDADSGAASDRAGTPVYMSPEQHAGRPLHEASDWYAVGTVLFEALTGRAPFGGSSEEISRAKQSQDAPRARDVARGVPEDLDALCADLLARDPDARPRAGDVLRRLNARASSVSPRRERFVGRVAEQAELARLFEASTQGERAVAVVRGPSGIGKSALLRRVLDDLRERHPRPLVLQGRCYEIESIPYKALDAVIDELSRALRRLPPHELEALVPPDVHALATLFPVLRKVAALSQRPVGGDASELRARAMTALRTIFARLRARGPVVVCIDDLQWGDADSATVLAELCRGRDAPAVLWVMSFREEAAATSPFLTRLGELRESALEGVAFVDLRLEGLAETEAAALAAELVGEAGGARAAAIAAESRGNPFFLGELARAGGDERSLDALVQRRVGDLDTPTRRFLEVLAVGARPLDLDLVAACAALRSGIPEMLARLRAEHLIRAREGALERRVECYHDRIREAVASGLAQDRLVAIHRALAANLEAQGSDDAARIGHHHAEGGDAARARGFLTLAAERASAALAFEDAAQIYRRAIALSADDPEQTLTLELALAETLSAAGHGPEAAELWLARVDRVDGDRRIDLLRRATEELVLAGLVEKGFATMDALVAELDLAIPRTVAGALSRIVIGRIGLALRGAHLEARSTPASPRELLRVDTLASLTRSFAMLDPFVGYALQTQHLRLALRSGDRRRAARALWLEAPMGAHRGTARSAEYTRRMLAAANELSVDDEQSAPALRHAAEGTVALLEGRWPESLAHLRAADAVRATLDVGHGSLRGSMITLRAVNLFWMGRAGELLDALPVQIRILEERGNLYDGLWLSTLEAWALSCGGHIDAARASSERARARLPEGVFKVHRFYLEFGQVKFLLIEGDAETAWQRLEAAERAYRYVILGQTQRVSGMWVRASAALALALHAPKKRAAMIAEARSVAQRLMQERMPWVDAIAATVHASIAEVEGERTRALALLAQAEHALEAHSLEAVLAVSRLVRGRLVGGEAGQRAVAQAEAWMKAQRVVPEVSRVLLPGAWG